MSGVAKSVFTKYRSTLKRSATVLLNSVDMLNLATGQNVWISLFTALLRATMNCLENSADRSYNKLNK